MVIAFVIVSLWYPLQIHNLQSMWKCKEALVNEFVNVYVKVKWGYFEQYLVFAVLKFLIKFMLSELLHIIS